MIVSEVSSRMHIRECWPWGEKKISIIAYMAFLPSADWPEEAAQNSGDLESKDLCIGYSFIQSSFPECLLCATLSGPVDIIVNKVGPTPTIVQLMSFTDI